MYQYYQPNPLNKPRGDCTIRALSKALNMSWDSSYIDLAMQGYLLKDMPSSNEVMHSYLRSKGFSKSAIPDSCPDCYSFEDFAYDHKKGIYIVGTGSHVACIKDGILYDSWDSSECVPLYSYKREYDLW